MKSPVHRPLFEFESADALARFVVFMAPLTGGAAVAAIALDFAGWRGLAVVLLVCLVVILGLRSSISVYPDRVVVVRRWFAVAYKTYSAPYIEDVFFGGDWGLPEGAMGVVVKIGGRELHLGTSRNMEYLHEALAPYVRRSSGYEV